MESFYIKRQKEIAKILMQSESHLQDVVKKCTAMTSEQLPPPMMMNIIGSCDDNHFKKNMICFFTELVRRFSLREDSNIFDLGCGCGRLAIPFAHYLTSGEYYGVDTWKDGIDWCIKNIATQNTHVSFYHIEAKNNYYFENNKLDNDFYFHNIDSNLIDLAFAISVFSHLIYKDTLSYLKEISRILRNRRAVYITCFIIDDFFHDFVKKTGRHTAVKEVEPGCYYAYSGQDFFAGYSKNKFYEMFEEAGLEVISLELGKWAQKPGSRTFQDTFILIKKH